jgi:hypothetical protein
MLVDRWVRARWNSARRNALRCALLSPALLGSAIAMRSVRPLPPTTIPLRVILVANGVRDSMNMVFLHSTSGWRKYPTSINPANFGRGTPIWRETMRCLRGRISTDTLWITGWETPHGERGFAAAVTGDCADGDEAIGSWHTHPWRADSMQKPIKTRGLSIGDLRAFHASADLISLAQWDRDSIAGAVRAFNGSVQYPIPVLVEPSPVLAANVQKPDSAVKP